MSGHGWVYKNPDGAVARCGGPGMCAECSLEFAQKAMKDGKASASVVDKDGKFALRMGYCDICGCSLEFAQYDLHMAWHEKLRIAVDETGTLG